MYVQRKSIVWDFPMFNLLGIDVILGMDSLSQNHSIIDCKKREVYQSLESMEYGKQVLFHREETESHPCIISYVKATISDKDAKDFLQVRWKLQEISNKLIYLVGE